VVLLSLSNTVQNAIIGNDNSLTGGHGRIVKHALARELLTHAELMTWTKWSSAFSSPAELSPFAARCRRSKMSATGK
jgi:hypothetical protein